MDRSEAAALARELMNEHGLTQKGWYFEYDRAVRRFGCCHYTKKKITISEHMVPLNDIATVRNTILHEIAHALAGYEANHGLAWKRVARSIGCTGDRCIGAAAVRVESRYIGTCPSCGHIYHRTNRPGRKRVACKTCCDTHGGGRFDARFQYTWKINPNYRLTPAR